MANLEALLVEAKDSTTSRERLREIWDMTKSSRVRKAISSNPNLDAKLLKLASRLYIKEVVTNSSVELVQLFTEDEFMKKIYYAYNDPAKFFSEFKISRLQQVSKVEDRVCLARAMLISPKLNSPTLLLMISGALSTPEFTREFNMNPEAFDRAKKICSENVKDFNLGQILNFQDRGLIGEDKARIGVKNSIKLHSYLTDGTFVSFFQKRYEGWLKGSTADYSYLLEFLLAAAYKNLENLAKVSKKNKFILGDDCLKLLSNLYRDMLYVEVAAGRIGSGSNSPYSWMHFRNLGSQSKSYSLSELIWKIISIRNKITKSSSVKDWDLESFYSDIKMIGFNKDMGPWGGYTVMTSVVNTPDKLEALCQKLNLLDDESLIFYLTANLVNREYYCRNSGGSEYSKLVDRINLLNQHSFEKNYGILYRYSSLDSYPTFCLDKAHPAIKTGSERYTVRGQKPPKLLPVGSGFISKDDLGGLVGLETGLSYPESKRLKEVLSEQ